MRHLASRWAELHVTPAIPMFASAKLWRIGWRETCVDAGWRLERVSTDNGSEFRNHRFDAHSASSSRTR